EVLGQPVDAVEAVRMGGGGPGRFRPVADARALVYAELEVEDIALPHLRGHGIEDGGAVGESPPDLEALPRHPAAELQVVDHHLQPVRAQIPQTRAVGYEAHRGDMLSRVAHHRQATLEFLLG